MENTKQSSGFEHLVTIATSSEDLTMTDQDTNVHGIGELWEEPADDELATTPIAPESGEMTVPEHGESSNLAIALGGPAADVNCTTSGTDPKSQKMHENAAVISSISLLTDQPEDGTHNDIAATGSSPDNVDEASEAAPDAFDAAVDTYDFTPQAPTYRYSIEELLYYRDSPNNTPLEQLRFYSDAPLDIVLRSNTSSFETVEHTSEAESHGSVASMSEDEEDGPQTGGVMIDADVHPERQPINPPEGTEAQKMQGFVRFLKKSIAPADMGYVTCGGRVIPATEFDDVAALIQANYMREINIPNPVEDMVGSHPYGENPGSQLPRPQDWPTSQSLSSTNPDTVEVSPMVSGAQLASAEAQEPTEAFPEYVEPQSPNGKALYMGSTAQYNDNIVQALVPQMNGGFQQMQSGAQIMPMEVISYPHGTIIQSSMPDGFNLIRIFETTFRSLWENGSLTLELWPPNQPTRTQQRSFLDLERNLQRLHNDSLHLGMPHGAGLPDGGPRQPFLIQQASWPGQPLIYAYQPPVSPMFPTAGQINPPVALANVQTSRVAPSNRDAATSLANMQADFEMLEEALSKLDKTWALNGDDRNATAKAEYGSRRGHLVRRREKLRQAIKRVTGCVNTPNAQTRHMPNNNYAPLLLSAQDGHPRRNVERSGWPSYAPQLVESVDTRGSGAMDTSKDYELALAIQQKYYEEDLARERKSRHRLSSNAPSFVPGFILSSSRSSAQHTPGSGSTQSNGRRDRQTSGIDNAQSHASHRNGSSKRPRHKRSNTDDTWNTEIEASIPENKVIKNFMDEHARNRALLESPCARSSPSPYVVASPSQYAVASPSPYAGAGQSPYAGPSSPLYAGLTRQSLAGPRSTRRRARFEDSLSPQHGTSANENEDEQPTLSFDRSSRRSGDLGYANPSFNRMSSANAETIDVIDSGRGEGKARRDVKGKGKARAYVTLSPDEDEGYAFRHWQYPGAPSGENGRTQSRSDREQKENRPVGEDGSSNTGRRTRHKASASLDSSSFTAPGVLPRSRENTTAISQLSSTGDRQTRGVREFGHDSQDGNVTRPHKQPTLRLRPEPLPQNQPTLRLRPETLHRQQPILRHRPTTLPQGQSITGGSGLTGGPPVTGPSHTGPRHNGYSPQDVRSSDHGNGFSGAQHSQNDRRGNRYDEDEDEQRVHEQRMRDRRSSAQHFQRSGQSTVQGSSVSQQNPSASRRRHRRERSPLMLEEDSQDEQPPRVVPFLSPQRRSMRAIPAPPLGPETCEGRFGRAQHGNSTTLGGNNSTAMTSSHTAPAPVLQSSVLSIGHPQIGTSTHPQGHHSSAPTNPQAPPAPAPQRNLLSFGTYRHPPSKKLGGSTSSSVPSSQARAAPGPNTNLGHNSSALSTSQAPAAAVPQSYSVTIGGHSENENPTSHLGQNSSGLVTSQPPSAPVPQSSSIGIGSSQNGNSSTLVGHNSSVPLPDPGACPSRGPDLTNLLESNAISHGTEWNPSGFPTQPRPSGQRNRPRANGGNPFAAPPSCAEEEKEAMLKHMDRSDFA